MVLSSSSSWPRRLSVSFWRTRQPSICSSVTRPMSTRISPRRFLLARRAPERRRRRPRRRPATAPGPRRHRSTATRFRSRRARPRPRCCPRSTRRRCRSPSARSATLGDLDGFHVRPGDRSRRDRTGRRTRRPDRRSRRVLCSRSRPPPGRRSVRRRPILGPWPDRGRGPRRSRRRKVLRRAPLRDSRPGCHRRAALRITSSGAVRPVQSSNESAACQTSMLKPSMARAPVARARSRGIVGRCP